MKNLKLFTILFVISLTCDSDVSAKEVTMNFRNIGTYATGLSYGHLNAVINFEKVKSAQKSLLHFLKNAHEKEHMPEKRRFYLLAINSMQVGTTSLERLEKAFFTPTRQKRQILAVAAGFGSILSLGLSIYNTIQLSRLQNQVDGISEGFEKVLRIFREENAAITMLSSNINHVKSAILDLVKEENGMKIELEYMSNQILLMTILEKHNAELSSWGRGVEALLFGNLDPTLMDSTSLQQVLSQLDVSVKQYGLKRLHSDFSSVFKADISYIATSDLKIRIFVHIPLVHQDPISLLEYIPVPFIHDELMLTIESPKDILAIDKLGIVKACNNGTHLMTGKRGLKEIIVEPHCHITTGQHYFWPQLRFDIVGDFIAKTTEVDISEIWGQSSNETVSEAYKELDKISPLPKRDLNELKNWITLNKQSSMHSAMSFGISIPALVLGLLVFTGIAVVFCAYKKANRSQPF